jgi:hypothetical protein
MANNIAQVELVKKRKAAGYPEGVDSESLKHIPWLLARIEELEHVLIPFAKAFVANQHVPRKLIETYLKDCARAWEMLDVNQGTAIIQDNFFENLAE